MQLPPADAFFAVAAISTAFVAEIFAFMALGLF